MKDARSNESGAWYCRDVGPVYVLDGTNPEDEPVLLRNALIREFTKSKTKIAVPDTNVHKAGVTVEVEV